MPKLDRDAVYELTRQIPAGRVTTYGALAAAAGNPGAARGVGMLMHTNPDAPRTPCHRVVYSDGRLGGYGAKEGTGLKVERLHAEGVEVDGGRVKLFADRFFADFKRIR
ncbi:MAG: MGMT family protein [Nitrososphaerota archaeon]|nr:MGMT family protein [Nitrososphaerota archaeon]MDG6939233.1 MGMT family protein [Nitrososphaerota archaeon]